MHVSCGCTRDKRMDRRSQQDPRALTLLLLFGHTSSSNTEYIHPRYVLFVFRGITVFSRWPALLREYTLLCTLYYFAV